MPLPRPQCTSACALATPTHAHCGSLAPSSGEGGNGSPDWAAFKPLAAETGLAPLPTLHRILNEYHFIGRWPDRGIKSGFREGREGPAGRGATGASTGHREWERPWRSQQRRHYQTRHELQTCRGSESRTLPFPTLPSIRGPPKVCKLRTGRRATEGVGENETGPGHPTVTSSCQRFVL